MQAWRLAASWMTEAQWRLASAVQAARTAALVACAGPEKAKQRITATDAMRIMGALPVTTVGESFKVPQVRSHDKAATLGAYDVTPAVIATESAAKGKQSRGD